MTGEGFGAVSDTVEAMGSEYNGAATNELFEINRGFGGRSRARTADLLLVRQAL